MLNAGSIWQISLRRDKKTDLVNKNIDPQDKVPTTPCIVELFTFPAQDLTSPTRFQTMQRAKQEDIPVVRIHASRVEEVKADKVNSSNSDYVLVSDPAEDFYENLGALFSNCEPVNEDSKRLRVNSVSAVEPFKHVEGTRRLDAKSKKTLQRLEPWTHKEDDIGIAEGRYPGPGGLVIKRPMRKATKSEDHG